VHWVVIVFLKIWQVAWLIIAAAFWVPASAFVWLAGFAIAVACMPAGKERRMSIFEGVRYVVDEFQESLKSR
jgi:hypothetical protein